MCVFWPIGTNRLVDGELGELAKLAPLCPQLRHLLGVQPTDVQAILGIQCGGDRGDRRIVNAGAQSHLATGVALQRARGIAAPSVSPLDQRTGARAPSGLVGDPDPEPVVEFVVRLGDVFARRVVLRSTRNESPVGVVPVQITCHHRL